MRRSFLCAALHPTLNRLSSVGKGLKISGKSNIIIQNIKISECDPLESTRTLTQTHLARSRIEPPLRLGTSMLLLPEAQFIVLTISVVDRAVYVVRYLLQEGLWLTRTVHLGCHPDRRRLQDLGPYSPSLHAVRPLTPHLIDRPQHRTLSVLPAHARGAECTNPSQFQHIGRQMVVTVSPLSATRCCSRSDDVTSRDTVRSRRPRCAAFATRRVAHSR